LFRLISNYLSLSYLAELSSFISFEHSFEVYKDSSLFLKSIILIYFRVFALKVLKDE